MRVPGKVVIVLDILFATTTMVAALAHGATEIVPVLDEAAARAGRAATAAGLRALRRAVRRDAARIRASGAARAGRARRARAERGLLDDQRHRGDDARAPARARVYCGALLNARRLVEHVARRASARDRPHRLLGLGQQLQLRGLLRRRLLRRVLRGAPRTRAPICRMRRKPRARVYRQAQVPARRCSTAGVGRMMAARGLRARSGVRLPRATPSRWCRRSTGASARAGCLTRPRRARAPR